MRALAAVGRVLVSLRMGFIACGERPSTPFARVSAHPMGSGVQGGSAAM